MNIQVPDNLEVKFTAAEIAQLINYLSKGTYEFVAEPIDFLKQRLLETHEATKTPKE